VQGVLGKKSLAAVNDRREVADDRPRAGRCSIRTSTVFSPNAFTPLTVKHPCALASLGFARDPRIRLATTQGIVANAR